MDTSPSETKHSYSPPSDCRRGLKVSVVLWGERWTLLDIGIERPFFSHIMEAGFCEPTHCREKGWPATGWSWETGRTEMGSGERERKKMNKTKKLLHFHRDTYATTMPTFLQFFCLALTEVGLKAECHPF